MKVNETEAGCIYIYHLTKWLCASLGGRACVTVDVMLAAGLNSLTVQLASKRNNLILTVERSV